MSAKFLLFEPIIQTLLESSTKEEEVSSAKTLAELYHRLLNEVVSHGSYSDTNPTHVDGGIALSSQHALDCLKDPLRTVRFIKGTYHAILDAIKNFPNEQIQLVYAGCGPGAPIIIPLLSLFQTDQLSITLLDINKSSIQSVEALIVALGAQAYFRNCYLGDAIRYNHPEDLPLHIVVSETMDKGLTKEPQVRITQNLAGQIAKGGILIPESIDVFTEHSFYSKEPYFDIYKNVLELGTTFASRDKQHLFSIKQDIRNESPFEFSSNTIGVPENFTDSPDICIYADVVIYGDQKLSKAQSLITNSFCLASLYNVKSSKYRIRYSTHDIPRWEVIAPDNDKLTS